MYLSLLLSNVNDVNATFSVIAGDFNAKSSREWSLGKDNAEGREINSLSSACGYSQLINKPTHVTKESFSCIDPIFARSPNLRPYLNKTSYEYGKRDSDLKKKLIVKTNECVSVEIISAVKDKYITRMYEKVNDSITAPKTYWKIINRFLSNKKIPATPPLLVYLTSI